MTFQGVLTHRENWCQKRSPTWSKPELKTFRDHICCDAFGNFLGSWTLEDFGDGKKWTKHRKKSETEVRRSSGLYFWRRDVGRGGPGGGFESCKFVDARLARFAPQRRIYGLPALPPTSDFLVCVFGVLDCGFVILCFVSLGGCGFVQIASDRSR